MTRKTILLKKANFYEVKIDTKGNLKKVTNCTALACTYLLQIGTSKGCRVESFGLIEKNVQAIFKRVQIIRRQETRKYNPRNKRHKHDIVKTTKNPPEPKREATIPLVITLLNNLENRGRPSKRTKRKQYLPAEKNDCHKI